MTRRPDRRAGGEPGGGARKGDGMRRGKRVDGVDQGEGHRQPRCREEVVAIDPAKPQLIPAGIEAVHPAAGVEIAYLISQVAALASVRRAGAIRSRGPASSASISAEAAASKRLRPCPGRRRWKAKAAAPPGRRDAGAVEPGQRADRVMPKRRRAERAPARGVGCAGASAAKIAGIERSRVEQPGHAGRRPRATRSWVRRRSTPSRSMSARARAASARRPALAPVEGARRVRRDLVVAAAGMAKQGALPIAAPQARRPGRSRSRPRSCRRGPQRFVVRVQRARGARRACRHRSARLLGGDLTLPRKPASNSRQALRRVAGQRRAPRRERVALALRRASACLGELRHAILPAPATRRHDRCGSDSAPARIPAHEAGCRDGRCARPTAGGVDAFRRSGVVADEPEGESALAEAADLGVVAAVASAAEARAVLVVEPKPLLHAFQADACRPASMLVAHAQWSDCSRTSGSAEPSRSRTRISDLRAASRSRGR